MESKQLKEVIKNLFKSTYLDLSKIKATEKRGLKVIFKPFHIQNNCKEVIGI